MVAEAQIRKHLSFMDWHDPLDGLYFNDQLLIDDDIHSIAAIKADILVHNRQWHLTAIGEPSLSELEAKALFVSGFKETWPEMAMDIDRKPDHAFAKFGVVREAHLLRVLRASVVILICNVLRVFVLVSTLDAMGGEAGAGRGETLRRPDVVPFAVMHDRVQAAGLQRPPIEAGQ